MEKEIKPIVFYTTPEEALAPLSANTEYEFCEPGCLDESGNTTYNVVKIPHPTYTNSMGKAVVQMNAVELGGFGGLNS
jgi:hypothetical protein